MNKLDQQTLETRPPQRIKEKLRKLSFGTAIILLNVMFMLGVENQTHAVTATQVIAYIDINQNGRYDPKEQGLPGVYFEFDIGEDPHHGFTTDGDGRITLPTVVDGFNIPLDDAVVENQARSVTSISLQHTKNGRYAKIEVGYSNHAKTPSP